MFRQKPDKEQHYQFLANIMQEGRVDSPEKAESHIHGLKQKSTKFSAIVVAVGVLLYFIYPKLIAFWFMITLGAVAWAWASTLSTVKLIRLYIKRELRALGT